MLCPEVYSSPCILDPWSTFEFNKNQFEISREKIKFSIKNLQDKEKNLSRKMYQILVFAELLFMVKTNVIGFPNYHIFKDFLPLFAT